MCIKNHIIFYKKFIVVCHIDFSIFRGEKKKKQTLKRRRRRRRRMDALIEECPQAYRQIEWEIGIEKRVK